MKKKNMGFHKRFVDKEIIEFYIKENKSFSILFKADAFIFLDSESSKVYDWYNSGSTDEDIKKQWEVLLENSENIGTYE
jgi:hypothetical protein